MKFRGQKVRPVTVVANSAEQLDKKLSEFTDIYDLQYSTTTICKQGVEYSALVLICEPEHEIKQLDIDEDVDTIVM